MTTLQALRLIRSHRPVTFAAFKKLGFKFQFIEAGVFREVSRIRDTDLVVKFPLMEGERDYSEGIQHSRSEMRRIRRLSKVKELKPYLPRVHYYDSKHGIIVMKWYDNTDDFGKAELLGKLVKKLIRKISGVVMSDIHEGNIRKKANNSLAFVDLGY